MQQKITTTDPITEVTLMNDSLPRISDEEWLRYVIGREIFYESEFRDKGR